jgi:hypothetical protein
MIGQRTVGLIGALLFLSICSTAQQKPREIKLTIKYNDKTVPNPDHVTLSSGDSVVRVPVANGKFSVPTEVSHAKALGFAMVVVGNRLDIPNLSSVDLEYEIWTLYLADHRYKANASSVPKHADIRSSCMLVLDSDHLDPGVVMFVSPCRSKN